MTLKHDVTSHPSTPSEFVPPKTITTEIQIKHPWGLTTSEKQQLSVEEIARFDQYQIGLADHLQSPSITLGEEQYDDYLTILRKSGRLPANTKIKSVNGALIGFNNPSP